MRILIVDDDTLIQKSLTIMFSFVEEIIISGCASNGAEAIEICKAEQPDIILMDIQMPIMDGITATRLIKKEYPNIRIMMFTTFEIKHDIQQALAAGADGYMLKTSDVSLIVEKLRMLMDCAMP